MDRAKIIDYLDRCGIRYANKGFKYLTDAIELASNMPDSKMWALYDGVAKIHGTTSQGVERAIRYEINRAGIDMHNREFIARALYKLGGNHE